MSFTALTYAANSLLTSTKMTQLQANVAAIAQNKFKNLVIKNDATLPLTTLNITADSVATQNYMFNSINTSVAITASGLGGLDTGSEAASTWYYIYVIYNPTTTGQGALLSTSRTNPTLPSGYTEWIRIGTVRNDAGSNFYLFQQFDHHLLYESPNSTGALSITNDTSFHTLDFTAMIPPNVQSVDFGIELIITHNTANISFQLYCRKSSAAGTFFRCASCYSQVANITFRNVMSFRYMTTSAQLIDFGMDTAASSSNNSLVMVKGYYDPLN